jgi:hypothetical protein
MAASKDKWWNACATGRHRESFEKGANNAQKLSSGDVEQKFADSATIRVYSNPKFCRLAA